MSETIIDRLYQENLTLLEYLRTQGEISFHASVNDYFRKTLLLSIASYFEDTLKQSIISFVEERVGRRNLLLHFLKNKAIERQYHTYFAWDRRNANQFFGLFGSEFKEFMDKETENNPQLIEAIKAFLELGEIRNKLVHQNFVIFPLEKTAEEIYLLYREALPFVTGFPDKLRAFVRCEVD